MKYSDQQRIQKIYEGFSAKCHIYWIYWDKKVKVVLKDHNLMQAIARVNRVYKDIAEKSVPYGESDNDLR